MAGKILPDAASVKAAEDFLDFLDPGGVFTGFAFQTYDDNKARDDKAGAKTYLGTLDQHIKTLAGANRAGYAVHVTINDTDGKPRKGANVVLVRKHFVEIDGTMRRDKILKLARDSGLMVARINESSPGKYHVYFNVADDVQRDLAGFTGRQKQLAQLFGGGRESVDLSRVLRLPGFLHQKGKPFQVRCVYQDAKAPAHSIGDFERALANVVIPEPAQADQDAAHDEDQTAIDAAIERLATWPRAITNTDTPDGIKNKKGNSTTYDAAAMCKDLGLVEDTTLDVMWKNYNSTRCDPAWSYEELQTIVRNAYRYTQNAQGAKHPHVEAVKAFAADPITNTDMNTVNALRLAAFDDREARKRRPRPADEPGIGHNSRNGIVFLDADKVKLHNVDYVWKGRLARGKHSLIAGEAGEGKSQISCDIVARVTTGTAWPDKEAGKAPKGICIMLTAEDDPEDTLVPRLIAAGADLKNVKILKMVQDDKGGTRKFSLETDMAKLTAACKSLGNVVLIVIDPVSSYMGGTIQGGANVQVRHVLDPLSDLAAELRCAILSITHFRKGAEGPKAVHRIMDSIAFGAAPRATFGIYANPVDIGDGFTDPRVMLLFKTNLPDKAKGLKYHIVETTGGIDGRTGKPIKALRIEWDGETELTADTVQRMENERAAPRTDEAKDFAERVLADGAQLVADVKRQATELGITESTLQRAIAKLGIKARIRKGSSGGPGQPGVWEYPGLGEDAAGDFGEPA